MRDIGYRENDVRQFQTTKTQKAHPSGWALHLFDAWQFMAGVLPATLRAVAPQRSNPLPADLNVAESTHRQTTDKTKSPVFRLSFLFYLMPGSSLLSHGETPHYHRR
ncbi:hypothetical protein, partial [Klebsiella oxytoca]